MELKKATLVEIGTGQNAQPVGKPIDVQFNPTSLRLQMSNRSEGGEQAGRQARQYVGSGSTTLSLELVFDTADEGETALPRSVLERTTEIERFIKPQGPAGQTQAPPRVRFHWGSLTLDGVIDSMNVDLDHFAADGTPLRAKVSVSIKGQDPAYEFNQVGPGATDTSGAPVAGGSGSGLPGGDMALSGVLGALGAVNSALNAVNQLGQTVAKALDGESLAQFAQRAGLDASSWRSLANGITDPLKLQAGQEITVPKQGGQGGPGATQAPTRNAASLLATTAANSPGNTRSQLDQGYALSRAGGIGAALTTLKTDTAAAAANQARQTFPNAGGSALSAVISMPTNEIYTQRTDPRADSFGSGVPLRTTVGGAVTTRANLLSGQAHNRADQSNLPPTTTDPTVPGWQALPQGSDGVLSVNGKQRPCDCGCGPHR
ncbi:LysM peptidoglycan-binding domain-containing protein [Chitinivorax sp. B]|uniref:CIS tube protein n=1 Tax=Chitinivorax sp. B TaxID=2502235 RepID=UPI0010F7172A|nr:LysM peptidoglycan-binding domain-containing protein [Chitinivorax sp. B]